MSAVQVAVRVRPFNGRETAMGSVLGIDMSGATTIAYSHGMEAFDDNNEGVKKEFNFDYSIWSHYPSQGEEPGDSPNRPDRRNVDQPMLYQEIGLVLFESFWGPNNEGGYDVCMFAYGQSGSGKSFSMTGAGPVCSPKLQGIIPRITTDVFKRANEIEANDPNSTFRITCSMLEIYIDKIYDLLIPNEKYKISTRKALTMQMDTVKGLSQVPVKSYDDVSALLIRGFQNQYKAPTGLNVDSSRGHTVFTMTVVQVITGVNKGKKYKQEVKKTMQLIDLAGSERSEKMLSITKAQLQDILDKKFHGHKAPTVTDKYFKNYLEERKSEGTAINTSLTVLGKCVEEVAKVAAISDSKKRHEKMKQISWRSSELTRLLRPALSGQSKTIMIAACSPSCTEFDETVSTMRYCNNIKKIPSTAVAKKRTYSPEEELKKQLEALQEQLAAALASGGSGGGATTTTVVDSEEMKALQQQMEEMKREQAEAIEREAEMEAQMAKLREEELARKKGKEAVHLLIMTSNPMTSGLFPVTLNETVIAGQSDEPTTTLPLKGTGVQPIHATFEYKNSKVYITPGINSAVFINGKSISESTELKHPDRLRLAADNYYRFVDPNVQATMHPDDIEAEDIKYDWQYIKEEAMSELLKSFEKDDQDAQQASIRAQKLQAELKERESEFNLERKKMEEALLNAKNDHMKEMCELEKRMKEMSEAGNKQREEKYRLLLQKEKEEAAARLLEQELALKKRLDEEKSFRDLMIAEHKKHEKARKTQKAQIHYDLLDVLPCIDQCNQYAKELNVNAFYDAKIVASRTTGGGSEASVMVELVDTKTSTTERWSVDEFRSKFGIMMQEYQDNIANIQKHEAIHLSPVTPFKINKDSMQTIGYATIVLKAIYFNMDVSAKVGIVSNVTGQINGQLTLAITPLWENDKQEEESLQADSLHQMKTLDHLDLEIQFIKCEGLPAALASDVRCRYTFPSYITSALLPEEYTDNPENCSDLEINSLIQKGGVYITPCNQNTLDKLIINPVINYKRVIRIFDLSYQVREWFKNADLMVEIIGEPPPNQISEQNDIIVPNSVEHINTAEKAMQKLDIAHGKLQTSRMALQHTMKNHEETKDKFETLQSELMQTQAIAREAKDSVQIAEDKVKYLTMELDAAKKEILALRNGDTTKYHTEESYIRLEHKVEELEHNNNSSKACTIL